MVDDPDAELRHGQQIGRFVVVGQLGKGGMGVVYAAHDPELDRQVALKVLRSSAATDEERRRMQREGQAMARVTHPNVITVYEVGVAGGSVFLAQELLDGGTLGDWLEKQKRSRPEILAKFEAAGRGLAAAHVAGLVHRDFKPDNVLLGTDGRVRVADFGLARALDVDDGMPAETRANIARAQRELAISPMSPMTRTGAVMGTPMFMAPEQHLGERADARSDQFAFCVALWHALYGEWPYPGKTAEALANMVIKGRRAEPPKGKDVPAPLHALIVKGLATKPEERFPSMEALLAELTRPPSKTGKKVAIAAGAIVLVAGAVIGGYALRTRDEPAQRPIAAFDPSALTSNKGTAWLLATIERGRLDDAIEKYDTAATAAKDAQAPAQAAIAWSHAALVRVLRGDLRTAKQNLESATASRGSDPVATAYVELASAHVSYASGQLDAAIEHGRACASAFTPKVTVFAAMCLEVVGDSLADQGNSMGARKAYRDALALAKKSDQRTLTLELALAAADLDDDRPEPAIAAAGDLQDRASDVGATSAEQEAWVLLARAHLAAAASQTAIEDLGHVKPVAIESFTLRIAHQIASGQAHSLLGDTVEGFNRIDGARTEAEQHDTPGLVLAARLARVEVMVTLSLPEAAAQRASLIAEAKAKGYARIAKLAETIEQR